MWPFSTTSKLWKVGKHRVKKVSRTKTVSHGPHSHKKNVTRYKCVDCERVLEHREDFERDDYTCYDVIQQ